MPKPCPDEVVETGRTLIAARKLAQAMSDKVDIALNQLEAAVGVMVKDHGAKAMQAGSALAKLRKAQAAYGLIMDAHNDLRMVLHECDVDAPTDAQVASIR
jgi:hypoxanthine phosphoribosyltransferase